MYIVNGICFTKTTSFDTYNYVITFLDFSIGFVKNDWIVILTSAKLCLKKPGFIFE